MNALMSRAQDAQERLTCMDALMSRAQDAQERLTCMMRSYERPRVREDEQNLSGLELPTEYLD